MQVNRITVIFILMILIGSCIDPFEPDIRESQELLVINGCITDQSGEQLVMISRSSPFSDPEFIPIKGCVVRVEDGSGNGITYSEKEPGIYSVVIDNDFVRMDQAYRLVVYTPDGNEYQSEYDSLLACPPVDKLYFEVERQETANPAVSHFGVRFYLDVKGTGNESGNFLWKLEETYEYRAAYPIQYIWDGDTLLEFYPSIDSFYRCYKTQPIKELHTASSRYLVANELNKYPLNFVSDETPRLLHRYSLLVSQHSLTDDAYIYWDKAKSKLTGTGGLYETQPSSSVGNIFNVNDPYEKVLGYFYASQVTRKRVSLENNFDFKIPEYPCPFDTINDSAELIGRDITYMLSLNPMTGIGPPYGTSAPYCFVCTLRGGSLEVPDFWREDE